MTGPEPTLGVVVVNHRRHDLLRTCLEHLATSSRPPDRIVVVDNVTDRVALAEATAGVPGVV